MISIKLRDADTTRLIRTVLLVRSATLHMEMKSWESQMTQLILNRFRMQINCKITLIAVIIFRVPNNKVNKWEEEGNECHLIISQEVGEAALEGDEEEVSEEGMEASSNKIEEVEVAISKL